jgi:putative ABC transport system permease protein
MKYLPLLWAGLWRKPIRTVLTLLSITVAFMLFGVLNGVVSGFDYAASKMSDMRLRVINRANVLEAMPISYEARIARIPGVRIVSHLSILVGYYQEPRNNVSAVGLTLGPFAKMFGEMRVPAEQIEALQNTRDGAVVGGELAKRYNWKIGDRVTLHSLNQVKADGSPEWTFQIVGLVNAGEHDEKVFANELYFNYEYLDEARAAGKGTVHQYALTIDDASHASEISQAIDREFANSSAETSTMNEREYLVAQLRQIGNVRLFVYYIIGAVLFTLLFLAGNTMAQSVRDRVPELGVLKTLGFSDTTVWLLVVVESSVLCLIAAALGLTIAAVSFPIIFGSLQIVGPIPLPGIVWVAGFVIAIALAALSALFPALRARRLTIVEALAGH